MLHRPGMNGVRSPPALGFLRNVGTLGDRLEVSYGPIKQVCNEPFIRVGNLPAVLEDPHVKVVARFQPLVLGHLTVSCCCARDVRRSVDWPHANKVAPQPSVADCWLRASRGREEFLPGMTRTKYASDLHVLAIQVCEVH